MNGTREFIKRSFLIVLVSLFLTPGCENELDLVAPYKEIGVVYGLLNPSDATHFVRVQKAFLGEGNALVMAQNPDSVYYPDILDVKLERVKNFSVIETISLTRFIGTPLEPGTFPSSPNILYRTNGEKIFRDSEYRLKVVNTETGYAMESSTLVVDSTIISRPLAFSTPINWAGPSPLTVEYTPGNGSYVSKLVITFHYVEYNMNTGVFSDRSVDWGFLEEDVSYIIPSDPNSGAKVVNREINGQDFYRFVGQAIPEDPDVIRYADSTSCDFTIFTGAEALGKYVEINSATTSILTTIPEYTNIQNGRGIFSSRSISTLSGKLLNSNSKDSLKQGVYTSDLGFQ
jgi:hypothetical protein